MNIDRKESVVINQGGMSGGAVAAIVAAALLGPAALDYLKSKPAAAPAPVVDAKRYAPIEYRWHVADGKKVEQYRENGGEWKAVPPGGIVVNPIK